MWINSSSLSEKLARQKDFLNKNTAIDIGTI